jgi:hypothetical protein
VTHNKRTNKEEVNVNPLIHLLSTFLFDDGFIFSHGNFITPYPLLEVRKLPLLCMAHAGECTHSLARPSYLLSFFSSLSSSSPFDLFLEDKDYQV